MRAHPQEAYSFSRFKQRRLLVEGSSAQMLSGAAAIMSPRGSCGAGD